MARIKKYSPEQNLSSFQTFIEDETPNSDYFRITEFKDTFTGGKNGFLIEGSEYLKESTEIKIELLDVAGNPIYFEPGNGIPEYYEGISKLIAVYIYNDTPIGLGKITVLGELKEYDDNGVKREVPNQWKGAYNVKWERTFQINKLLANEDKVRFYRRPEVTIDEIVKPIFSGNPPVVTQTGVVDGIPLVPNAGTDLSNFTLPTNYRLKIKSGNKWTGSIDEEIITFDNINYAPKIKEIVNENEIIVSPPYAENNIVTSFTNESYSLEFPYIENVADLATALTGSFAKISITDMKTFVGDAARVKVFRRSQSNLTDFEFVQEIQLESNEVLRDITTFAKKEEPYGFFTQPVIDEYWVTSSNDFNVTFNQDVLYNSAKLNSSPDNFFFTTESFSIQNGVEYTLDFNVRKGENTSGDYLKVFLSGSNGSTPTSQTITTINSSNGILQKTNINENIIADTFDSARLYFEVSGSDWYVNNVSLKASQETSFSPDEITFVQQVPKFLVTETFDYRFEFYDINNNFIPVRVEDTKTFSGGNTNLFEKDIEITPDNLYFSFDSASNPANAVPPLTIAIDVETTLVTGSITYTSGAFDSFGNLLSSSQYVGGIYPGYLTNWDVDGGREPFLRVEDFTGSRDDISVQFIRYTGAIEGVSDTFIISRVEDGKGGVSFEIVPFRGLQIKNKESKTLEIQAVRVDGINRINLRSGLEKDFSEAKLHVLSSSLDGLTEVNTYVSLSQAITNPDFLEGVTAGETGSGEIDYNAIFDRDAIDNELTVYLMDGPTTESILTSEILTDLKDGLNPGLVTSTADQFNIKYKPREAFSFDPTQIIVTSSFQQRGSTLNPLTASLVVKPSASIQPLTELPELFVFYDTGAFDDTITVAVTNVVGDSIDSGVPGDSVPYYTATQTKQLNFEFTYTEPITSASVTANKTFFITPDGLPGQDSIVIDIDPNPIALGSNHKGDVYNYGLADTDVQITQGDLFLINTGSGNPGTFTTTSVVPTNIVFETLVGDSTTTMSLSGFETMSALSASVQFDFNIFPYFTASLVTASKIQKFTKIVDGGGPIEVTLDPIANALNADEIGFVSDYSSATTEVFIKQDDEFFFYDEYDGGRPGTFVTASISASNIEFSELSSSFRDLSVSGSISSSGGEVLHFKGFGGLANNQPSASITYNFKVYPYSLTAGVAGVPRIVSKTQTFSKVNDGTAARKVSLVASSDTVIYDGDGVKVAPSGDIVLSATAINVTGSAFFKFLNVDGSTVQASSTNNTATVGDLPATGSTKTFTVELRDGNSAGTIVDTDSVTLSGIAEGSAAYSVVLSNPASSVTVEVDGTTYFDNAGTLLRAYKGGTELQYVEQYNEQAVDPVTFLPIGTFGQFSASIHEISSFLTQGTLRDSKEIVSSSGELYASSSAVTNWNSPQQNTQGFIVFKIDFENGRGEQFVQQSFSTVFEGATGPGIVVRGEWDEEIAYIFDLTQKRRDAVFREISDEVHYWATTEELINKSEYTEESDGLGNDDGIYTAQPVYSAGPPATQEGDIDAGGWQYLGQQDFFVAAKLAIFEESFVKNTINVGEPPPGNVNANIAIVGGTDEPYIAVGQTGTQGFGQPGAFLGVTNDMGGAGAGTNSTSGILSLTGTNNGGSYNQLKWDGETLTIRGSIRQTSAGATEPTLRGIWATATVYAADDLVIYNGQSWTANSAHTSDVSGDATDGPPAVGPWTAASGTGKTVSLSANTFVIAYDQNGNNPSPSSINVFASSSNFIDPYFKFTGGGTNFTDETTFTDGSDTNNDIVSSIDLSGTTISDMPLQFRVGVADGGLSGQDQTELISDVINIFGVKPGSDTEPNFFITPTAGGTQIKNSSGNITLQVQKADLNGVANITSGTDARIYDGNTLLAVQTGVTDAGNGVVYNPTIDKDFINGTKTLLLKDGSTPTPQVLDSITLLDVTDGLGGGSFIASNLKTSRDSITNIYTPTTLTVQASFYDTSGTEYTKNVTITPNWSGTVDQMKIGTATGASQITITADDGDGTSMTLGDTNYTDTKDVVVTAVFTDPATSQTTTINETFYIISDGADGVDGITVINTNQAHSLPASSAGVVSSYTNSGTEIRVFEGVTALTKVSSIGAGTGVYTITATQSPASTMNTPSFGGGGTTTATVADFTSMDNNEDTVTITYNISGIRLLGDAFTATTTQTLTKVKDGTDGADGDASGIVYAGAWKVGTNNTYNNPTEYLSGDLKYVVKYNDGSGDRFYTTEIEHYHRGDWVANTQDYAINDIIFNPVGTNGSDNTYYVANSSITGQSRTTNPQASSLWTSLGAASNLVPMNGGGGLQLDGDDAFAIFGAQFTSVATDILFAEDVYANRTINVGTGENNKPVISLNADTENGSASPFISIGQATQSFEEDGIFIGYPSGSAAPVLSLVSGSDFMIYNDGVIALSNAALLGTGSNSIIRGPGLQIGYDLTTQYTEVDNRSYNFTVTKDGIVNAVDAFIKGTIDANDGNIGQWVITPRELDSNGNPIDGTGGILQDDDGEIRFDPNVGEIQIYSASLVTQSLDYPATSSVTVQNSKFYIDYGDGAEEAPVIYLERSAYGDTGTGGTVQNRGYYFDLSDSSLDTHEFSFSMRENGIGTYGGRYNKSTTLTTSEYQQPFLIITSSADPGNAGAYIQIIPSASMESPWAGGNGLVGDPSSMEFWYYCENHVGMGNRTYIYNDGFAYDGVPEYTERVTIGSQDAFTETDAGGGTFTFAQSTSQHFYKNVIGISTTSQYGFLENASEDQNSIFSANVALDAGPVLLTDIDYPSLHLDATGIVEGEFNSPSPNYSPSVEGQVHGGNQIFGGNSYGSRAIYQYLELWNDDTSTLVATKYLSALNVYGANEAFYFWQASSSGGGGINSVVGTTEITLEDGNTKLAKDITLDDKILAWDSDTDKWVSARISKIKKSNVSEIYKVTIDGNEIEVSDSHKFWLFGNQKNSGQIIVSELYKYKLAGNPMTQDHLKLWVKDGDSKKKVAITNIRKIEKEEEVITFTVPNYVNYISNNIISHNVFGSLSWNQQNFSYGQSNQGLRTVAGGTSNFDVEIPNTGNYKVRFRINLRSRASTSVTVSANSSATTTTTYGVSNFVFDSDNTSAKGYLNNGSKSTVVPYQDTISIQKNNNFIEILPAGIQVVSGTGRFTRLHRRDQDATEVELVEVVDGAIKIESRNQISGGTSTNDKMALSIAGNIKPTPHAAYGDTSGWNLGASSNYFREGWMRELNGTPIGTMQLVAACYFGVSTSGNIEGPYNDHNVSSVTRASKGEFTVTLTSTTGFSLSSGLGFANGYGRNGSTDNGPGTNLGDNEFSFNTGVKVKTSNVEINVKDNNGDQDRDPNIVYFVLFSD
jgi:hypothetical protein|tara:strand:+ start:1369 stop:11442 length:10074 start_codon:yes stop_codon:yes gene_type:complete